MSRRTVGTERDDEAYNMRHSGGRGIAVYFGFSEFNVSPDRIEVEDDKKIMKKVYENLGFNQKNIRLFENLSDVKLKKEIKKLQKTDYTNFDCIFITFCGENIKSLIGKPKIFLFQCCRGSNLDDGVEFYADSGAAYYPQDGEGENIDSGYRAYTLPTTADLLITMSTTEGYAAFRVQLFKNLLEILEDAKLRNDDFASVISNNDAHTEIVLSSRVDWNACSYQFSGRSSLLSAKNVACSMNDVASAKPWKRIVASSFEIPNAR
ncbi:hypothetical protein GE061_000959 [Apolygus lucorum]|uniref:Caspase family p20 domain-containing protein n=1 Tax=Apolygus lucorum TaxID=248454 RepID=A0A8S9YB64_APOLU|nr:hypothetical protein GE061_000959 [Apolygus lucorum]